MNGEIQIPEVERIQIAWNVIMNINFFNISRRKYLLKDSCCLKYNIFLFFYVIF